MHIFIASEYNASILATICDTKRVATISDTFILAGDLMNSDASLLLCFIARVYCYVPKQLANCPNPSYLYLQSVATINLFPLSVPQVVMFYRSVCYCFKSSHGL